MTLARIPLILSLTAAVATASSAWAQPHYTFKKIADTVSDPNAQLNGDICVALSNAGTVVINSNALRRGDGSAGLTDVAAASATCPSINDLDEIAHTVYDPSSGITTLVRDANGVLTTLAAEPSDCPRMNVGRTFPSLSNSGSAVYEGGADAGCVPGIYIGPGGVPVVTSGSAPQLSNWGIGSMNDSETVAFYAYNSATQKWGVYRGSAVPLFEDQGTVILSLSGLVINNAATVAFVGSDAGGQAGVFKTDDGQTFTYLGRGGLTSGHDRISMNNGGVVAFDGTLSPGSSEKLYLASGSGPAVPVIGVGDTLDGSTVIELDMFTESLNDSGQLVFQAELTDGRWGVYRADPNRPPVAANGSLSVAAGQSASGVLSATDPDGDSLAYSIVSSGTKGTATLTNASTGAYQYVANAGASGTDTFTFKANDGYSNSNTATVTVTIAPAPTCATNVTATVTIASGRIRLVKGTTQYAQSVTLKGNAHAAVQGPISFVLDQLPAGVSLLSAAGTTQCAAPVGSPYVTVNVGPDDVLSKKESVSINLIFQDPSKIAVTYTPRVLSGPGTR
jgi:hypothetical protein